MTSFALWLVDWLFSGTLILAAGAAATAICRQVTLRERIAEIALAAAVVAAIPAAISHVDRFSLGLLPAPAKTASRLHIGLLPWNPSHKQLASAPAAHSAPKLTPPDAAIFNPREIFSHWAQWLPMVYVAGVICLLGRLLAGAVLLRQIIKHARHADLKLPADLESHRHRVGADILVSSAVVSPLAAGWHAPVILLPEGCATHPQATAIVAHELGHIHRKDIRWRYLISIANAVLFLNPLAYYLANQARLSQEILADQYAAGSGPCSLAYAEMLLSLIKSAKPDTKMVPTTAFLLGGRSQMLRRLEHIAAGRSIAPSALGRPLLLGLLATATVASAAASTVTLQQNQTGNAGVDTASQRQTSVWRTGEQMRLSALRYLAQRQNANGAWLGRYGPAVTALVIRAFLQAGASPKLPRIADGLHFIESCRHSDGGYYLLDEPAYNTAIVVRTLSMLHSKTYVRRCTQAMAFLRSISQPQSSGSTGIRQWFSGHSTIGRPPSGPVTLSNATAPWLNDGNLDPHERPGDMRLKNYGSITYAQLKSMIYASLSPRDPRVARLSRWLREDRHIQINPAAHGAPGLFYFSLVYARVMRAMEHAPAGNTIQSWRSRLIHLMQRLRRPGGYWENTSSDRWLEGNRIMATTYAALIFDNVLTH